MATSRFPGDALGWVPRDESAPVLTDYDDATDARVELSATTLRNWVAKTANLLQDEFDIGPGRTVALALPVHWQTAACLLGAWACGAAVMDTAVEDGGRLAGADVVLAAQDRLAALEEEDLPDLLGLALHPLGMGMSGYAGQARDFALEVRAQADVFTPYQRAVADDPALVLAGAYLTHGILGGAASEMAERLGIEPGDRILVDPITAAEAGPVAWLLAPLAAGASIILCRNVDTDRLARRAATEQVTATLGYRLEGVRRLGA